MIGAVLVGVNFAKGLAYAAGKPLVPVHHLRGHIAALYLTHPELKPPFLCLVASGGHSHIVQVESYTPLPGAGPDGGRRRRRSLRQGGPHPGPALPRRAQHRRRRQNRRPPRLPPAGAPCGRQVQRQFFGPQDRRPERGEPGPHEKPARERARPGRLLPGADRRHPGRKAAGRRGRHRRGPGLPGRRGRRQRAGCASWSTTGPRSWGPRSICPSSSSAGTTGP